MIPRLAELIAKREGYGIPGVGAANFVGLIVHCILDKRRFVRKDQQGVNE